MTDEFEGWGEGSDTSESDESSEQSGGSDGSKRSEQPDSSESLRKPANVKKEWDGYYLYVPSNDEDEIRERIEKEYERLRFECSQEGESMVKDRHFKPVLVLDGLEALEEMEGLELLERAEGLGFR